MKQPNSGVIAGNSSYETTESKIFREPKRKGKKMRKKGKHQWAYLL